MQAAIPFYFYRVELAVDCDPGRLTLLPCKDYHRLRQPGTRARRLWTAPGAAASKRAKPAVSEAAGEAAAAA